MKKRRIIVPLIILLISLFTVICSHADFGDFSGDYDYGGGDDYSYDNDWDDDDDDDYNSGWSDNDSGGGNSSGGSIDSPTFVIGCIIFIIIIIALVRTAQKKERKSFQNRIGDLDRQTSYTSRSSTVTGRVKKNYHPMSEYVRLDPQFNESKLTEQISNLYVKMQNDWTKGDISELRPYFTDAVYNQFSSQLNRLNEDGLINYVERISVLGVKLLGYNQTGKLDVITAEITARITDYTVQNSTGNVVKGSKTAEKFMVYEWDLCRTTGKTTVSAEGMTHQACPNCGAPIDINASAKCPYCDHVVSSSDHDWAISAIRAISQTTMGS